MAIVEILPGDIIEENGQTVGTWQVRNPSRSPRRFGADVSANDKVVIPECFEELVNQARVEQRSVRVQYIATLGVQTATAVHIV